MIYVCCSSASLREVQVLDERGRETEIESERLTEIERVKRIARQAE